MRAFQRTSRLGSQSESDALGELLLLAVGGTGTDWGLQDRSEQRSRRVDQGGECRRRKDLGMAGARCRWAAVGVEPECCVEGFRFYPESDGELLEGFEHGNNKFSLTFGKDQCKTLSPVQIRLKGMRQEAGKLIGSCCNGPGGS